MFNLLMKPTTNWFFAFTAVVFATLTLHCIMMLDLTHKPKPVRGALTRQERLAYTMIDLYGQDWYGEGCGQHRCRR